MAHLPIERAALDTKTKDAYTALYNKLGGLIDFVSKQLPPNTEEFLYKDRFSVKADDSFPKVKYQESLMLTNIGIVEVLKGEHEKGEKHFGAIPMDAFGVVAGAQPETFNEICKNMQKIINKYKIEIPKEYL